MSRRSFAIVLLLCCLLLGAAVGAAAAAGGTGASTSTGGGAAGAKSQKKSRGKKAAPAATAARGAAATDGDGKGEYQLPPNVQFGIGNPNSAAAQQAAAAATGRQDIGTPLVKPVLQELTPEISGAIARAKALKDAEATYKKLAALHAKYPTSTDVAFEFGNAALRAKHPDEAVLAFGKAATLEPTFAELHVSLGIALVAARRVHAAGVAFSAALTMDSLREVRKPAVKLLLGSALREGGHYAEAIKIYKEALGEAPVNATFMNEMASPDWHPEQVVLGEDVDPDDDNDDAVLATSGGQLAESNATALLGGPGIREAYLGMGRCYFGMRKFKSAFAKFVSACALRAGFDCRDGAGQAAAYLGDWPQARQQWTAAIALNPKLARFFGGALPPMGIKQELLSPTVGATVSTMHPHFRDTFLRATTHSLPPAPAVITIDKFLTSDECDSVIHMFKEHRKEVKLQPLVCFALNSPVLQKVWTIIDRDDLKVVSPTRDGNLAERICVNMTHSIAPFVKYSTSTYAFKGDSPLLDVIEQRLDLAVGLPAANALSSQLVQYDKGIEYAAHTDCTTSLRPHERVMTAVIYLNTVKSGGGTVFPRLNISVNAVQGRVVVFSSGTRDGFCDPDSEHASARVEEGTKYIIQKWYLGHKVNMDLHGMTAESMRSVAHRNQPYIMCDGSTSCREYFPYHVSSMHTSKDTADGLITDIDRSA